MSSHETDEHISHNKLYNYHQSVLVSSDIEYIVLVPHGIDTSEIGLHLCKIWPLCSLSGFIPPFQRDFCIFSARRLVKNPQFPM